MLRILILALVSLLTLQATVSSQGVNSFKCPNSASGVYPTPKQRRCSNSYYLCVGSSTYLQICPGVTVFDDSTGHCSLDLSCLKDSTDSTKQEASTKVPANCSAGDGNYSDPSDCHKFYMCSNGNPYTFECPSSLVYNARLGICDWPENVPHCMVNNP